MKEGGKEGFLFKGHIGHGDAAKATERNPKVGEGKGGAEFKTPSGGGEGGMHRRLGEREEATLASGGAGYRLPPPLSSPLAAVCRAPPGGPHRNPGQPIIDTLSGIQRSHCRHPHPPAPRASFAPQNIKRGAVSGPATTKLLNWSEGAAARGMVSKRPL